MGVGKDPEALPTTTKLSLRLDEVEAMLCYVSQSVCREKRGREKQAEMHDSAQHLMPGFLLSFILATHQY